MSVTSANGEILISADDVGVIFNFPPSAITSIVYSSESYRRSTRAYNYFDQRNNGNDMLAALAMALTAPFGKSKKHVVDIQWHAAPDKESEVSLEFRGENSTSFLNWLQQVSGKKWVNLDEESKQAQDYIARNAASSFRVKLKDPLGGSPHDYYVLPIELSGKTNLYFFQGSVKPKNVTTIVPVNTEYRDNACIDSPAVLYSSCRSSSCDLAAVVLPAVTFRVITPNVTPPALSDCDALRRQQATREAHNSDNSPAN